MIVTLLRDAEDLACNIVFKMEWFVLNSIISFLLWDLQNFFRFKWILVSKTLSIWSLLMELVKMLFPCCLTNFYKNIQIFSVFLFLMRFKIVDSEKQYESIINNGNSQNTLSSDLFVCIFVIS